MTSEPFAHLSMEELEVAKTELWRLEQDIKAEKMQIEQEMRRRADEQTAISLITGIEVSILAPSAEAIGG